MVKVLHINTKSDYGGAAQTTLQLHRTLNEHTDTTSTFVSGRGSAPPDVLSLGVSSWKLYTNVLAFRTCGLDGPLNVKHWQTLEPLIESTDIVHLHNAHGYYLPQSVLDRLLRKPTVWTLHDYWLATGRRGYPRPASVPPGRFESLWPKGGYDYPVEWFDRSKQRRSHLANLVARHCPTLVPISHDMATRLSNMGIAADRMHVIHDGVFADTMPPSVDARAEARHRFGWSSDERILLFVAAEIDNPIKGWLVLAKALHQLTRPQDWHLVIIGNDRNGIVRTPGPVRTTALGPLAHADVMTCFRAADVYANPTLDEAMGRTAIEALGEGIDVLCSDIPVLREMAESAVFFPVGSPDGLAAMLDSYQPVEPAARIVRAAAIREEFSTIRMVNRYKALYGDNLPKT
jgi:Glycosyltransferase Family 4/Glycosyl transferases group 1